MTGLVATAVVAAPREPTGWDAWRIRDAVATGELRAEDVVRAHLARLDEVQPALHAAVVICREEAIADARRLQVALDAGSEPGALCGVPFTVKDVIATAGTPTCCGSAAFAGNVPAVDAAAVRLLRAAGAILIAKTNCPEFAFGITTDNQSFGVTRSPWGESSPGGSSGGEAALVAAGAAAFGLGTDYGGSLRWPAQSCGVLALRPSVGAVDGTGQLPERGGRMDGGGGDEHLADSVQRRFQVVGPLARSVRDLALVLEVLAASPAERETAEPATTFGWVEREDSQPVGAEVLDAMEQLVHRLCDSGAVVEVVPGLFDGLHRTFNDLRATDDLRDLRLAIGGRRAMVGANALQLLDAAPASTADPAPLWTELARRRIAVDEQLQRTPILLFPVAPVSACALDGTAVVDAEVVSGFALMAQCRAVTALGGPSLSIPIGRDGGGLPISVQVVGAAGADRDVLRAGEMIERLTGGRVAPPWTAT